MDGSPVNTFPHDVFKELFDLDVVSTQNYKLCCDEILPDKFEGACCSPKDEVSSCEDLLQSWTYRAFLWLISCLALTGNVFCFVVRLYTWSTTSSSGFSIFVVNLTMADFLMGVYTTIIGVADERFQGRYLHYDDTWKNSVACQVAGFLSLLSSEVSALIIWLITLDRFVVLSFPFTSFRFERISASSACLLTWLVGCSLAVLPLLPVTTHWEFFSQTGMCIPLPVTRRDFKGRMYSFGVLIVLNFVLFLLIAVGQGFIFWSVQRNAMTANTTRESRDMTVARRLISVAATDFLCWFPTGLCGILALAGIPVPGEVSVALVVFALPLNAALNPFMYTFNTVAEKRRKSKEAKLLRWLESHYDQLDGVL
ncbi:G-protein coupled receptor GRL101-like [Babylonia areolata]|uniref:G-protein coupled receptor GRL101-like n=1 Tax=Babylonia areolata TaxID=304850 RepID=UPI003FD11DE1